MVRAYVVNTPTFPGIDFYFYTVECANVFISVNGSAIVGKATVNESEVFICFDPNE